MGRSRFLTFLFGLIPGAGQMYLGLMQKGSCIMLLFWGAIALAEFLSFSLIGFLLPVIWFYSFFDTLFLSRVTDEERALDQEDFMDKVKQFLNQDWKTFFNKYRVLIGVFIIILGIHTVSTNFLLPILHRFGGQYSRFYSFFYDIPELFFGILLLIGGIYVLSYFKTKQD